MGISQNLLPRKLWIITYRPAFFRWFLAPQLFWGNTNPCPYEMGVNQSVLWCHVLSVPGNGAGLSGAVRWGGLITVSCTCAHIRHATLLYFLLHFHTRTHTRHATSALLYILSHFHTHVLLRYCMLTCTSTRRHTHTHVMLQVRYCTFSRTSTLMSCYATVLSLALPHAHTHTRHATSALLYIFSRFHTHVFLHYCTFSCRSTRTHTHVMLHVRYCTFSRASPLISCYATVHALALQHALTRHATSALLYMLSRFHTHVILRYCAFSCTSTRTHTSRYKCATVHSLAFNVMLCYCTFTRTHTHTSCYKCATVHSLALPYSCRATLLYVVWRLCTHVMLRYCAFCLRLHTHGMLLHSTLLAFHTHVMLRYVYALLHLRTFVMLRYCTFCRTSTRAHTSCYKCRTVHSLARPRSCHATLLYVLLRFHTHVMLRYFFCHSTHMSCYATVRILPSTFHVLMSCYASARSLQPPHSCHATLLYILVHFHTHTHTHTSCYKCATVHSLALPPSRHATVRSLPSTLMSCYVLSFSCASTHMSCYTLACSLALRHVCHATLLLLLLHFHTHVMLRYCAFACLHFHLHTSCYYSTVRSLALPHSCHATLLYIASLVFRYCTFSCASTHMSRYANIHSLALPHTFLLRFSTFSCASTYMSCYTLVRSLALPGACHATLLYVFFAFPHTCHATLLYVLW